MQFSVSLEMCFFNGNVLVGILPAVFYNTCFPTGNAYWSVLLKGIGR